MRQSDTSITVSKADQLHKTGQKNETLYCQKTKGLFLRKQAKTTAWRFRYTDIAGIRKTITLGNYPGIVPRQAAGMAQDILAGISLGVDPVKQKQEAKLQAQLELSQTVGAFFNGPYTDHQGRKKAAGIHTLRIIKCNFADWFKLPMSSLTKDNVRTWQRTREQEVTHRTLLRAYGALKTMLNYAVVEHYLEVNPLEKVSLLPAKPGELSKRKIGARRMLTDGEVHALHAALEQLDAEKRTARDKHLAYAYWFVPFFHTAYHLGMRTGDLKTLQWSDVNLRFKRVVKTLNKTAHQSNPARVDLPINATLHSVLTAWWEQCGKPETGLVFPSPKHGGVLHPGGHNDGWRRLKELAGDAVPQDLVFYSLRHHFISTLVSAGVPLLQVAKLVGHRSTRMIEQHYGHLAPSDAVRAMQAMELTAANNSTPAELKEA